MSRATRCVTDYALKTLHDILISGFWQTWHLPWPGNYNCEPNTFHQISPWAVEHVSQVTIYN